MHTVILSGVVYIVLCLVHSHHTKKYVMLCSVCSTLEVTLHKILSYHMSCFLTFFRNPNVQHRFDKSIPQSAIPKPTWNFVQGNGSKLNIKHDAQPATVPTVYQPSASKSRGIPSLLLATSKALLRFSMWQDGCRALKSMMSGQ
jgi:hypothetical protein